MTMSLQQEEMKRKFRHLKNGVQELEHRTRVYEEFMRECDLLLLISSPLEIQTQLKELIRQYTEKLQGE